jgi:hypothetical protein
MTAFRNPQPHFGEGTNMNNERFARDTFIEENISKLAQEETGKRQYYRPVYSLHKWWARRSGAQFRSIILLAAYSTDKLFIADANGTLSKRSDYFQNHDLEDVVIFDPFKQIGLVRKR